MFLTVSREIFWNIKETKKKQRRRSRAAERRFNVKILGAVLAILYAGLMLFAVCREKQWKLSSLLIAAGSVLVLLYTAVNLIGNRNIILIMIAGMLGISAGALINGMKSKELHVLHHIVRFIAEAAITVLCWMGK